MRNEYKGSEGVGHLFQYRKLDEDGSGGDFQNSYMKTDTPVKTFNTVNFPSTMEEGIIYRIHYRLKPTNAVTYTLRLYAAAIANDYESNMRMLWESPPLQASDMDYDRAELMIPAALNQIGVLYYAIEWTAAPGVTPGFIAVEGVVQK